MVIRGSIRGNGEQLGHYLLSGEVNEKVQILEVDGRSDATERYLHQTMQGMSLTAELTKSPKGLYHAQINPAYSEDRKMSGEDWLKAADILAGKLGLSEQRRVVVLHTKKNRTHAHVVWERYDHQTGKVVANTFSRLAQDRARKEMERVFEHKPTPHRNQHRPDLKESLTALWHETPTGAEFIQTVHEHGYLIAEGVPRHPFMVVDENGRSFDLVRQLQGVRIKEVRQRLRSEKLIPEKEAIELMRQKQEGGSDASQAGQQRDQENAKRTASAFLDNKQDVTVENEQVQSQQRRSTPAESFIQTGQNTTVASPQTKDVEKKKSLARDYFLNADELTINHDNADTDKIPFSQPANDIETQEECLKELTGIERGEESNETSELSGNDHMLPSQSDIEPDRQPYQEDLREFMHSAVTVSESVTPITNEDQRRQQTIAQQFFANEEITKGELSEDEKKIQELMQEQKNIRERSHQRVKRRSR